MQNVSELKLMKCEDCVSICLLFTLYSQELLTFTDVSSPFSKNTTGGQQAGARNSVYRSVMFTLLCGGFIQDTTHQICQNRPNFYRRTEKIQQKTFWLAYFWGHDIGIITKHNFVFYKVVYTLFR